MPVRPPGRGAVWQVVRVWSARRRRAWWPWTASACGRATVRPARPAAPAPDHPQCQTRTGLTRAAAAGACVRFRFLQRPEYLTAGTRFVFREGRTKGIGVVIEAE
jgi:hypothetical protein